MNGDGGLPGEMGRPPLPRRRQGSVARLDDDTLTRLLDGRLAPADAPPDYAPVSEALDAAAGPARAHELRGEAAARAAFTAAITASPAPRRNRMQSRIVTRLAALTAAAFVVGGVAAAASTDLLSGPPNEHGHAPASESEGTATTGGSTTTSEARGPDVNGPAKFGLCHAYFSGKGVQKGGKADSTAFEALATAAASSPGTTDAARITAFCAGVTPGNGNGGNETSNTGKSSEQHGRGNDTATNGSHGHGDANGNGHRP